MLNGQGFKARAATLKRGSRTILEQISLALIEGEVLCLLGANGAGKSSFLSALAGELPLDVGGHMSDAITLNGQSLERLSAVMQARARAVLPQKPGLGFDLSVAEVVGMGAYPFRELTAQLVGELTGRALDWAGVAPLALRRYLELSGGEQQRVQFARVLLQALANREADPQARYLLLDEPTASLDPLHQQQLLKTVVQLARQERIGVLVILHDLNLAARWGDRIALLAEGRLAAFGSPAEVVTTANLKHVYGVDTQVIPHPQYPDRPLVVFV